MSGESDFIDDEAPLSSVEEIIEDAQNGRPFILVDAADRENEGDVIIPAQFATPEQINFMAKHARGLICLALTNSRARELRLAPMATANRSGLGTAFTMSIEASEGVTTGISAYDRAHTIAVAVNPAKGADDIVSPGHVFPLVAREGGVLVRAGHTEAAVDIARLADLSPSAVICEIMSHDGTMARLPELRVFAREHGLRIATIADLIAYRRRTERQVERVVQRNFSSIYGDFELLVYRHLIDNTEHVVLMKGPVNGEPTLTRMHRIDLANDLLGYDGGRHTLVGDALLAISLHNGPGVAVFLNDANPSWLSERYSGLDHERASSSAIRDYGVGAQILRDLNVRDMILMSSSDPRLAGLEGYGLRIVGRQPLVSSVAGRSPQAAE